MTPPSVPPQPPHRTAARQDALPPGTPLDGYLIEKLLDSSRLGHVYQGRDTATGQRVVLKEFLPVELALRHPDGLTVQPRSDDHTAAFERGRMAFLEEAQLLRRCHHPSLLRVLRAWGEHGTAYRSMNPCLGDRLDEVRRAMPEPPDEPALRALLDGLLGALDTLHSANAVHGDLRASRVLLLSDDRALLMDGAAVRRAIAGDALPLRGDDAARAEDLHALAALAAWCIAGDEPAPAPGTWVGPDDDLPGLIERQQQRFPEVRYSDAFVATLHTVLSAAPRQRVRSVARFRALLNDPQGDAAAAEDGDTVPLAELQRLPDLAEPGWPGATRARGEDPYQARTLAALQVALDSISTPAPAPPQERAEPRPARRMPTLPAAPQPATARRRGGVGVVVGLFGLALAAAAATWFLLDRGPGLPMPSAETPAEAPAAAPPGVVPNAVPVIEPVVEPVDTPASEPAPALAPEVAAPAEAARPAAPTPPAEPPRPVEPAAAPAPVEAAAVAAPPSPARPAPAPPPVKAAVPGPASPRAACGARSEFSLYRCMQTQCKSAQWSQHAQCVKLRSTDTVD